MWVEQHDKNAEEHRKDIRELKDKVERLINGMPCRTHAERMTWFERLIIWSFVYTSASVAGVIAWVQFLHNQ